MAAALFERMAIVVGMCVVLWIPSIWSFGLPSPLYSKTSPTIHTTSRSSSSSSSSSSLQVLIDATRSDTETEEYDDNDNHKNKQAINGSNSDYDSEEENAITNLRLPQIHLPPRFIPGQQAWRNHHQATLRLVHNRGEQQTTSDQQDDNDNDAVVSQQQTPRASLSSVVVPRGGATVDTTTYAPGENPLLVSSTPEWKALEQHVSTMDKTHLRDLLKDQQRCDALYAETQDGVYLDYSRQRVTLETMDLLIQLAEKQNLKSKINDMFQGKPINFTEKRSVLHTALRAKREDAGTILLQEPDGKGGVTQVDAIQEVHEVLDQIKSFTEGVRSGKIRGYTGKRLRNIVSVGIGGSYLGPEFLHEVLKTEPEGINAALGYSLRFLSNVDPVDVERTCTDLDPEETLIVIVSKTFTTAETMLNARTMRQWLWDFMGNDKMVVQKHIVACASISALKNVQDFGIDTDNYFFRFWDWVGGRYSVCSAAGAVPISLLYGYNLFEKFLEGARSMDEHYLNAPFHKNIPVIMGLLGVWNMSFLRYNTRTILPYAEALLKLPAHIQQLDMESNGKYMTRHNIPVDYAVGEIDFGEPGTNGQHSFYQLLHMGQTVPCEFIGFVTSQHDLCLDDESLSSHDELMANFFAQPDALANGKTLQEVQHDEKTPEAKKDALLNHKVFQGNRPSLSLLFPKLTAYATGQILALYEHRTATQGFIWDINSFDQWGVELGKKLAIEVKDHILQARQAAASDANGDYRIQASNPASSRILNYYIDNSSSTKNSDDDDDNNNNNCYGSKTTPTLQPPKQHKQQQQTTTRVTRKTFQDHQQEKERNHHIIPPHGHDLASKDKGKLS